MGEFLLPRHWDVVAKFSKSRVLLAFDFDGTLAPIVINPAEARMRPETKELLRQVAELYPCAVISGRAGPDVRRRLHGTGIQYVVGNHGADLGDTAALKTIAHGWKPELVEALAGWTGVWVEDKGASLAVHYRRSPVRTAARRKVLCVARRLHGARLVLAKQALNVIPVEAPHKGMALELERVKLSCEKAMYVGDDTTDEDAFALASNEVLGIRVGARRDSAAQYWLRRQTEIDELLKGLVELRTGGGEFQANRRVQRRDLVAEWAGKLRDMWVPR